KKRALFDEFGEVSTRQGFDEEKARQARAWQQQAGAGAGAGGFPGFEGFEGFQFRGRSGGFDPGDLSSMFGDIFAQRQGGRSSRAAQDALDGDDIEAAVEGDLRDAVLGAEREIAFTRPEGASTRLKVKIPPGVETGSRVRL